MYKLILALMLLSTVCFANDLAKKFEKGYPGIKWETNIEKAKAILKEKGVEFEETTSKYIPEEKSIRFSDGDAEANLGFYMNQLAKIERYYMFDDPDNRSMDYWKEKLAPVIKGMAVDNDKITADFSVPSAMKWSVSGGDSSTTINFSLNVYSKKMQKKIAKDEKKRAEKKIKDEADSLKGIVDMLIDAGTKPEPKEK